MELWIRNGQLVSKDVWESTIDKLHMNEPFYKTKKQCISEVREVLTRAVQSRIPSQRFAVFLSGGIDSSLLALLAKKFGGDLVLVSVGLKDSPDLKHAKVMADMLCVQWVVRELSLADCEDLAQRAVKILPSALHDSVHVGISAVVIAAVEAVKSQKIHYFIGGLGAEEIFAGYQRHVVSNDAHEECWAGLKRMWSTDLVRDAALGKALGITVVTPFLDEELIRVAMRVPAKLKIVDEERKVILRDVAEIMGVPHDIAWRKKQAAHYGSGVDKVIEKLARTKGLGKTAYVRSLL
ncbi:MAG TPA: asparagine synthase-related protein [Candidatus Nanoarchaeia archaeon]|nr:asparagine synthase-related protein [Candidatus Nanoarchaeia archaeon]